MCVEGIAHMHVQVSVNVSIRVETGTGKGGGPWCGPGDQQLGPVACEKERFCGVSFGGSCCKQDVHSSDGTVWMAESIKARLF